MKRQAKVSVIVPVFNAGEMLVPSIESLLNQTLKDIEIIIVNDASTDNSGSVIDQLAKNDARIVPVHLPDNKGVHEARLAGLKESTAPWIGFLDADDFARPKMFSKLLSAAVENDVDIVVCGSYRVNEKRNVIESKLRFVCSEKIEEKVFERFCAFDFGTGMLWNKLFRRSVIEPWFDLHFPWRQRMNEDLLLNIGCFHGAQSVYLLRDSLHEYVLHEGSVTTSTTNHEAFVETFKAYVLAVVKYKDLGQKPLVNIIDMYRAQLGRPDYQVASALDLTDYEDDLNAAVSLLYRTSPHALVAVAARKNNSLVGFRIALKSICFAVRKRLAILLGR